MADDSDGGFDEDEVYDLGLSELERRHDLERIRNFGARVEVEMTEDTVLRRYMESRRSTAVSALIVLSNIDPSDKVAIAKAQATVSEFLNVRDWARGAVEAAEVADEIIQRESNGQATDSDIE